VFPGFEFGVRAGKESFRGDLHRAFPGERRTIDRYFRDVDRASAWTGMLAMRALAPRPLAALAPRLPVPGRSLALRTTGSWLREHVRDERLRAVLGARWPDYGLPPAQSAFLAHAVITRHYYEGAHYPAGAAGRIAEGARRVIESAGGALRVRAEVERILVANGRAAGVRLAGGETLRAPVVISAAGARATYLKLLGDEVDIPFREKLRAIPAGMAHVSLYLGLSRSPTGIGVRGENYWLHDALDHDGMWARSGEVLDGKAPQIYVSFPSLKDPEARAHTAELVAVADAGLFDRWRGSDWMRRGDDYRATKERIADGLLRQVERRLPGLSGLVAHRELSTPLTTEHFTGHLRGEIYGLPATPERFALPWLGVRTPLRGLYLAGADAMMLGVGGALMSGVMCAAAVAGASTFGKVVAEGRRLGDPTVPAATPAFASAS